MKQLQHTLKYKQWYLQCTVSKIKKKHVGYDEMIIWKRITKEFTG